MHVCFDVIHSTLYRMALPNFTESAKPAFLASAPRDWIYQLRYSANTRALSVQFKLRLLEKNFPENILTSRLFNLFVFGSMRVQLQYNALAYPDGVTGPFLHGELAAGFETMMNVVGKMTRYFADNRRVLKDMLLILARHGYNIGRPWDELLR